ncbi:hypothetical protein [Rhizobium leguminosarum]|uniref:hypothetical protein n=1 Tax=Rhizobium leguminosarum TaxID=384 RepID=UPI001249C7B1|nr:hypothetical protein [Rhizobium leguminosarum]
MTGWRGRIATRLFLVLLTPPTFGKSSADVLNTDFVTELYRAANEVGKPTAFEKRRLIERAVTTVKPMRVQIAFSSPPRRDGQDILVDIATVGGEIVSAPNQIVSHALLEAADLIRTLKIVPQRTAPTNRAHSSFRWRVRPGGQEMNEFHREGEYNR